MAEGSLWVYGNTDLTAFYRDELTLRQVWNRLICLPHEAPINRVLEEEQGKADAAQAVSDIENVLSSFQK